eukprot:COSAG02_NODE_2700_length_8207_cov_2.292057_6_plen_86_part_00
MPHYIILLLLVAAIALGNLPGCMFVSPSARACIHFYPHFYLDADKASWADRVRSSTGEQQAAVAKYFFNRFPDLVRDAQPYLGLL